MKCSRCHGMMVVDHYVDIGGSSLLVRSWRCINCGSVVDPLIDRNRRLQKAGVYEQETADLEESEEESLLS